MNDTLKRCLDDLEARIDPEREERLLAEWKAFTRGDFAGDIFTPRRDRAAPPAVAWPGVRINATLEEPDAMLLQQYGMCSSTLAAGNGSLLCVRSNYGTSILPLLFGVKPFVMPEDQNTLPTSEPLNDVDAMRRIVDAGMPDLTVGYGERVLEMGRRFVEIARAYPKIGKYVHIYHPDLQGPMDICEVVWGSTVFMAVYDVPELVEAFLTLVTETYIAYLREWEKIAPLDPEGNCHWGLYHGGRIMLRDDSAMNLSPRQFARFVAPYDRRLLETFGGGAIHFCGKGDHFIAKMAEMPGLSAINLTQPEYNDMERIFAHTIDRGINLLGLPRAAAEEALARGRDLRGRVHCA